jgi:hypothetical protein
MTFGMREELLHELNIRDIGRNYSVNSGSIYDEWYMNKEKKLYFLDVLKPIIGNTNGYLYNNWFSISSDYLFNSHINKLLWDKEPNNFLSSGGMRVKNKFKIERQDFNELLKIGELFIGLIEFVNPEIITKFVE